MLVFTFTFVFCKIFWKDLGTKQSVNCQKKQSQLISFTKSNVFFRDSNKRVRERVGVNNRTQSKYAEAWYGRVRRCYPAACLCLIPVYVTIWSHVLVRSTFPLSCHQNATFVQLEMRFKLLDCSIHFQCDGWNEKYKVFFIFVFTFSSRWVMWKIVLTLNGWKFWIEFFF